MSDWLLVDKDPPLATITINRPETRNAINYQMWGELSNLFLDLDDDKDHSKCHVLITQKKMKTSK